MDDTAVAGLTITTATLALSLFDRCLPPVHTVADRPPTDAYVHQVQSTCLRAAPVALGLGVGAALVARTPWPAVAAVAVVAWMWWTYDSAARSGTTASAGRPLRIGRYGM